MFADFFSTTLAEIGVPLLCEVLRKMSLKFWDFEKFDFRFWQNLTPHYLKTLHGEGTSFSDRAVEKKSANLLMPG